MRASRHDLVHLSHAQLLLVPLHRHESTHVVQRTRLRRFQRHLLQPLTDERTQRRLFSAFLTPSNLSQGFFGSLFSPYTVLKICLLYTSDAADEEDSVD